jgi:hypothetical protein
MTLKGLVPVDLEDFEDFEDFEDLERDSLSDFCAPANPSLYSGD